MKKYYKVIFTFFEICSRLFLKIYVAFILFFNLKISRDFNVTKTEIKTNLKSVFKDYNCNETLNIISPIWQGLVSQKQIEILKSIEEGNIDYLLKVYKNYINSSLVYGVEDPIYKTISFNNIRYSLRNMRQLVSFLEVNNYLPLFHINQPSKNIFKLARLAIKEITVDLKPYLNLQSLQNFNRYRISDLNFPTDFFDVLYFYRFITNFINDERKFIEIGGGSGLLSYLLLSNKNFSSYQIDIASYLFAQKILLKNSSKFLLSERIDNYKPVNADFVVNQDSFPEITIEEVKKLVNFIKKSKVKLVFSNNHNSNYMSQTDFRSFILEAGYHRKLSFPNPIRPGYLIEVFSLDYL